MITVSPRFKSGATLLLLLTTALLVLTTAARSQQDQPTRSLGDFAREQQQIRKQQTKRSASRVYSDMDASPAQPEPAVETAKPLVVDKAKDTADKKAAAQTAKPQSSVKDTPLKLTRHSIFDQAKSKRPDFIIVPAGTAIRVDIVEGKVAVPVQVGFATPIPALSIAAVRVNPVYYTPVFYHVVRDSASNAPVAYGESAELAAVTVRGVTYPVQARAVPLNSGVMGSARSLMSNRDAVFVLTAPLPIER